MKIVRFKRACQALLRLFYKHMAISTQGLSLLSRGATWFATNFFMVAGVLDRKESLKQMVTDVEWDRYMRNKKDMHKKLVRTQIWEVKRLMIQSSEQIIALS
jgi:hypothetical protein